MDPISTSADSRAVALARRVLRIEAAAVAALADRVGEEFERAVDIILKRHGRVIVTGIGKSGHIARKIAATLASTGTPAFFVHPTEALHGDLGMITEADAILAISHSGESAELKAILAYGNRFGIPVIALTGKPDSTLGKAATYVLNTHVREEACPLKLAPTTSTTVALALGDALATALIDARGFRTEDFAAFHPGGKLGAQLLKVAEVMLTRNLPLLPATVRMREVLVEMTGKNLGCVGFTDVTGRLVGILTDGDLKRLLTSPDELDFRGMHAADVMTPGPKTIDADSLAAAGVARMEEKHVKALWVVDAEDKPAGLFRLEECMERKVV